MFNGEFSGLEHCFGLFEPVVVVEFVQFHAIDLLEAAFELRGAHHCCFGEGLDAGEFIKLDVAKDADDAFERFEVFFATFCPGFAFLEGGSGAIEEGGEKFFGQCLGPVPENKMVEWIFGICIEDVFEQLSAFEGDGLGVRMFCFLKEVRSYVGTYVVLEEGRREIDPDSFHPCIAVDYCFVLPAGRGEKDIPPLGIFFRGRNIADDIKFAGFDLREEETETWFFGWLVNQLKVVGEEEIQAYCGDAVGHTNSMDAAFAQFAGDDKC